MLLSEIFKQNPICKVWLEEYATWIFCDEPSLQSNNLAAATWLLLGKSIPGFSDWLQCGEAEVRWTTVNTKIKINRNSECLARHQVSLGSFFAFHKITVCRKHYLGYNIDQRNGRYVRYNKENFQLPWKNQLPVVSIMLNSLKVPLLRLRYSQHYHMKETQVQREAMTDRKDSYTSNTLWLHNEWNLAWQKLCKNQTLNWYPQRLVHHKDDHSTDAASCQKNPKKTLEGK